MAADAVGIVHTTIARKAKRDPRFAADLADAENHTDVAALTRIQEASAENKNWRAAASILERRHPEEFGRRAPHSFSGDQIMALLAKVFSFTMPRLAGDQWMKYSDNFNAALRDVEAQVRQPDRWRNIAERTRPYGYEEHRRPPEKVYRSPYEHPQWRDSGEFERLMETFPEGHEAQKAWVDNLSYKDNETFYYGFREWLARNQRGLPDVLRVAGEIKRQMDEEAALEATDDAAATCPSHPRVATQRTMRHGSKPAARRQRRTLWKRQFVGRNKLAQFRQTATETQPEQRRLVPAYPLPSKRPRHRRLRHRWTS